MSNSEDGKKGNKSKLPKNETVKNTVINYLQKRNYTNPNPVNTPKNEFHTFASVENEVSSPNSILYRCYNCDPLIIDTNFSKLLNWIKELGEDEDITDLEKLVAPMFCHLYLDILQGGHPEKAAAFFLSHLASVEKVNQDSFIKELIKTLSTENDSDKYSQEFRTNKYVVQLTEQSKEQLMHFVKTNCHLIILQELQTWFEIQVQNEEITDMESDLIPNEVCLNPKFQKLMNAAAELEKQPPVIKCINVSNLIAEVNCGLLSRYHGWLVYNQDNLVYVKSIHNMNRINSTSKANSVRLNGHSSKVYALTISKHYLVSGSSDGKICIYHNENFENFKECVGHLRTVYHLKISSNEYYLASGSEDNTIKLWNTANGELLRVFVGHEQAVVCVDFHPNCLYLISGSCDNTLRFWRIDTAASIRLLYENKGTVRCMSCHPDGKILVSASDDQCIRVWDILTGKIIFELTCKDAHCNNLRWSKNGNLLCGSFSDNTVKIWDVKIQENNVNFIQVQIIRCNNTIIDLEYCFGTFGVLTIPRISQD